MLSSNDDDSVPSSASSRADSDDEDVATPKKLFKPAEDGGLIFTPQGRRSQRLAKKVE
jgi:hypothetical protein